MNNRFDAMYNSFNAQFTFHSKSPAKMIVRSSKLGTTTEEYSRDSHGLLLIFKIFAIAIPIFLLLMYFIDKRAKKFREETLAINQARFSQHIDDIEQLNLPDDEKKAITNIADKIIERAMFPSRYSD